MPAGVGKETFPPTGVCPRAAAAGGPNAAATSRGAPISVFCRGDAAAASGAMATRDASAPRPQNVSIKSRIVWKRSPGAFRSAR